jgi:hypothetical protein
MIVIYDHKIFTVQATNLKHYFIKNFSHGRTSQSARSGGVGSISNIGAAVSVSAQPLLPIREHVGQSFKSTECCDASIICDSISKNEIVIFELVSISVLDIETKYLIIFKIE